MNRIEELKNRIEELKEKIENFNPETDTDIDFESWYDDFLDEEEEVTIGNISFSRSLILSKLDPLAYKIGMSEYIDNFDNSYFDEFIELESELEDLESELEDLESELEDLEEE